jgi:hypothetical protein
MIGTDEGVKVALGGGRPAPGTILPLGSVRAVNSRETGVLLESKSSAQA